MRRYYPILFFSLVTLLVFWKVLLHREFSLLAGTDISVAYFPWFDVASYWLKRGVFLLWDPYVNAGKMNMGEPQPGLFYPLNWLFMLAPARSGGINLYAMQALIIFDYFLATLFFYFLARSFRLTFLGAAVAGITWAYGGFTTQLYGYVNVLSGFVWLPLTFLFFRRGFLCPDWKQRIKQLLTSGAFLALSFLPGHHVPPVHIGLFLFLYAAFNLIRHGRETRWCSWAGGIVSLGVVALTGMLLTAIQWLPSLEWARQVYRWIGDAPPLKWGEAVPYSALQGALHLNPQDAASLLLPYVSTNLNLYVGFTVLFLSLVGMLFVGKLDTRFFTCAAFLYFFLSTAQLSAVHGWVNTFVPGIWFAREVFHYLIPFQACLALLAGWGLDHLMESYSGTPSRAFTIFIRRAGWTIAVLVIFSGALATTLVLLKQLPMDHIHVRGVATLATYMTAFGILLFFLQTERISPRWFGILATALIVVDLSSHISKDILPKADTGDPETTFVAEFWKKPPAAEFLIAKREQQHFRVDDPERIFPLNFGDAWRLDATLGHNATALVDYFSLRETGWGPGSNASALLNARYFLSRASIPEFEKVFAEEMNVYKNPRAVARAFVARRYRSFPSDRKMLQWIAGPMMAPSETVLLRDRDRSRLPPSFWDGLSNEDEGFDVQVISAKTAAQKRAESIRNEREKRYLYTYPLPWGWSTGDEATLLFRSAGLPGGISLILNYYPTGKDISRPKLELEGPEGARDINVELPGIADGETAPERPKQHLVHLGDLVAGEYKLFFLKRELCSVRVDSLRLTRLSLAPGEDEAGTVSILSSEPNRLQLSAKIKSPSFVVISEVFYPGWEALVDGQLTPVFAADYILRAVPVSPGEHAIELRFRPRTFMWGFIISLASACSICLLLITLRKIAGNHQSEGSGGG